jgi:hypothetical protein
MKSYLVPLRLVTNTFKGVAVAPVIPAPVGVAVAVKVRLPRRDAFQLQVATMLGEEPVVLTLIQPGILTLLSLKVTFELTVTFAEIAIVLL